MSKSEQWLATHAHAPSEIRLGLERVEKVLRQLNLPEAKATIVVAGTNGKGSVTALLTAMLTAAGFNNGCHTSPHLLHIGERVQVNGVAASDDELLQALQTADAARQQVAVELTYFELITLAAAVHFARRGCEIIIQEVGLGGRLDAVNVFSPTVTIITNIGIDHIEYLGAGRDSIAVEKAGVCRRDKPVIVGDAHPPPALCAEIRRIGAKPLFINHDFSATANGRFWHYHCARRDLRNLPPPAILGGHQITNAACALAALQQLPSDFWPGVGGIRGGLHAVTLPGRTQVLPGQPTTVLDVAHNTAAAAVLERFLFEMGYFPQTRAVVGMMARKDAAAFAAALDPRIDAWYLARPRQGDLSAKDLAAALDNGRRRIHLFSSIAAATTKAHADSNENDRILITGSFLTVSESLTTYNNDKPPPLAHDDTHTLRHQT